MNPWTLVSAVWACAFAAAQVSGTGFILEDTPLHCSVRRSISPCTCSYYTSMVRPRIIVLCQKMESFESVIGALQNKFDALFDYVLNIEYSNLHDLDTRRFNELGFPIFDLKLSMNNLRYIRFIVSPERRLANTRF